MFTIRVEYSGQCVDHIPKRTGLCTTSELNCAVIGKAVIIDHGDHNCMALCLYSFNAILAEPIKERNMGVNKR